MDLDTYYNKWNHTDIHPYSQNILVNAAKSVLYHQPKRI